MMIEEAREQLKDLIRDRESFIITEKLLRGGGSFTVSGDDEIYRKDIEALEKALEILEKQIPKNPKRGACPSCGSKHIYAAALMKAECFKYCGDCGQAIDWSDNDD